MCTNRAIVTTFSSMKVSGCFSVGWWHCPRCWGWKDRWQGEVFPPPRAQDRYLKRRVSQGLKGTRLEVFAKEHRKGAERKNVWARMFQSKEEEEPFKQNLESELMPWGSATPGVFREEAPSSWEGQGPQGRREEEKVPEHWVGSRWTPGCQMGSHWLGFESKAGGHGS